MALESLEGITNEPMVNFVGKDGFYWWVGEVESNKDPSNLGRVQCRVLGYYTNVRGGTTSDLKTDDLPWATVLQHTCQAGNDGQGESSGQLQPGAIVMGFFMDGENAQMPIVIGVMRVSKKSDSRKKKKFAFTGENMEPGAGVNRAALHPLNPNAVLASTQKEGYLRQDDTNNVQIPGTVNEDTKEKHDNAGGPGSPVNAGSALNGSSANPLKPRNPSKPVPAANGVAGPWKTLEYQLSYLFEDLADTAGTLIKAEKGDFIDIATGKLHTAKQLTAKIQNFLGAVFAQVVSAMRQALANLAEQLQLINILGGATGAPFVIWSTIQAAVTAILSSLCAVDNQILGFIQDPVGSITSILEGYLEGVIDKATMVMQGVQSTIDSVICNVQNVLNSISNIISTVSKTVDSIGKAKEIIEAWKKGTGIFAEGFDLMKNGITSISGLIALFIRFIGKGCDRKPKGGEDTVGWYPLFGVTHCTEEELAHINKIRGSSRGTCGGSSESGSLFDAIFREADPFVTKATTYINGAYDLMVGTPGRAGGVKREASGTTHTSININNATAAKKLVDEQIAKEEQKSGTKVTDEERNKRYEDAVKANTNGSDPKMDSGNLVADHISWAGVKTEEIHGDECKVIDGTKTVNVEGDYHLKITGDCHLEVGGMFALSAQGAPKVVDKNGNSKDSAIQKHSVSFGSDVDVSTTGAKIEFQGAEFNIATVNTHIESSKFDNSSKSQTRSAGELVFSADNSITNVTPNIYNLVNVPPIPTSAKSGITNLVGGSIDSILVPGGSGTDAIPRFTVVNPAGPVSMTSGATGHNINSTIYSANIAGAAATTAGAAISLKAGGAIGINAGGAVSITGSVILLN